MYNTTAEPLDIGGMWLDDIAGNATAPVQIPAGTIIQPGGYYIMEFNSYLNNSGDTARFLSADQATVFDSKSYASSVNDKSKCRTSNGSGWYAGNCTATKNAAN